jgi:D-sedoheptulose 7-phosphate isomerase
MSDADLVRVSFGEAARWCERVAADHADQIVAAAGMVSEALLAGRQALVFGNGGSATDAAHFAAELVGRFSRPRRALAAVALTTDSAVITSVGNDFGFDQVFARQVEALGRSGDVAIGITTSGVSANVNAGLEAARAQGLRTIGLTGRDGGQTGRLVDVHVNVPASETPRIQEVHRVILHVICELVERRLA